MLTDKIKSFFEKNLTQHCFPKLSSAQAYQGWKYIEYNKELYRKVDLNLFEELLILSQLPGFSTEDSLLEFSDRLFNIAVYLGPKDIYFDIASALALHKDAEKVNKNFLTHFIKQYVDKVLSEFKSKQVLSVAISNLSSCYIDDDEESYISLGEDVLISQLALKGSITKNTNFLKRTENKFFLHKIYLFLVEKRDYMDCYMYDRRYEQIRRKRIFQLVFGNLLGFPSDDKLNLESFIY